MVRDYEAMYIIQPVLEEEAKKAVIEKFQKLVESSKDGKVVSVDEWGKRRLAYEVDKKSEGHYVLMNFSAEPAFIDEMTRIFKITDDVLKYLIVKKEK